MSKVEKYDKQTYRKYTSKLEIEKALNTLEGIILGINIDNELNSEEINELVAWCELYSDLANVQPLAEILFSIKDVIENGLLDENFKNDIYWLCNNFKNQNPYFDVITSDIQKLHGILADGNISDIEIRCLKNWLEDNKHLSGIYPYDEIYSLLISILDDGKIDINERQILEIFFTEFIDTNLSVHINKNKLDELKKEFSIGGICAVCPEITIQGKTFCFTGTSSKTNRKQISEIITSLGGFYNDNINKSIDYLIIGNNGNPCWTFSCYGRKVEQAINMRKKGHKILIVHENDFWDTIDDLQILKQNHQI